MSLEASAMPAPADTRGRMPGDRAGTGLVVLAAASALLVLAGLMALAIGPVTIPAGRVVEIVFNALTGQGVPDRDAIIVLDLRLPRLILGAMVGAALGLSGATMQGLFRNPLADPGIVGVSSGAALAAVFSIVMLGGLMPALAPEVNRWTLPIATFVGGLATTALLYAIATRRGMTAVTTLMLAGIAVGALAAALTGYLVFRSNDLQLRTFTFWTLGSLAGATSAKIYAALPFVLAAGAAMPFLARGLNALALGESEAFQLGVNVQTIKRVATVASAALVGAAVSVAGVIGFIGLVVPHLVRLVAGPDHRLLLPASAIGGAALLIFADVFARIMVAPAELPIGILTATFGAPFFLWLLLRERPVGWD